MPELVVAGLQGLVGNPQVAREFLVVILFGRQRRLDLQGQATQVLRQRIMQFDGQSRAFLYLEIRLDALDLFPRERLSASFGDDAQCEVPDEDTNDDGDKDADDDEHPAGGQPRRMREDSDVVGIARDNCVDCRIGEA